MSSTLYIQHTHHEMHSVPHRHPENPLRILAIETKLRQSGLWQDLVHTYAKKASRQCLELIHGSRYLDQLNIMTPHKGIIYAEEDTPLAFDSLKAVEEAAGAGMQAVDAVLDQHYTHAFCSVRPPGHHAEPNKTMGFCFVNNIAIAAEYALKYKKLNRVLILDFDVHQGNGTVEAFAGRDDVMVISSFQHPFYPFSHWQSLHDNIINIPIPAETGSIAYRRLVESIILKSISSYKPELILLSAGFDAHISDPMGELELIEDDYYWITNLAMDMARLYSNSKIVSILEGGYDLEALAFSAHAHLQALTGN